MNQIIKNYGTKSINQSNDPNSRREWPINQSIKGLKQSQQFLFSTNSNNRMTQPVKFPKHDVFFLTNYIFNILSNRLILLALLI